MTLKSPLNIRVASAVVALVVLVAIAGYWLQTRTVKTGTDGPGAAAWLSGEGNFGGAFTLVDHTGKTVTQADFKGRYMLIYFGYTFCPDTCPVGLSNMTLAMELLADNGASITPVFITIDPGRDTVKILATYVEAFHPRLVGLTGTEEQIAAVAKNFRAFFTRLAASDDDHPDNYFMGHTNTAYLVGPDGKGLTTFSGASEPETIAEGFKKLVRLEASRPLSEKGGATK